jgi:hypothetical protein
MIIIIILQLYCFDCSGYGKLSKSTCVGNDRSDRNSISPPCDRACKMNDYHLEFVDSCQHLDRIVNSDFCANHCFGISLS